MSNEITINDDTVELNFIKTISNQHQEKAYKHFCIKKIAIKVSKNASQIIGIISALAGAIATVVQLFL